LLDCGEWSRGQNSCGLQKRYKRIERRTEGKEKQQQQQDFAAAKWKTDNLLVDSFLELLLIQELQDEKHELPTQGRHLFPALAPTAFGFSPPSTLYLV
jgi:hypothetical protein